MTKYELRITGECKQNLKICKKRGLPQDSGKYRYELVRIVSDKENGKV
jgi:hypothetical protein